MKRIILLLISIAISLLFTLGAVSAKIIGTIPDEGKSHPTIKVVLDDNYPPYAFRSHDGSLQGILVDVWEMWGKKTGITPVLCGMPWNTALSEMGKGSYDVIDTMFYSKERADVYEFSAPYVNIDVPIFFPSDISGISGPRSLTTFRVAVKKGDNCIGILKASGVTNLKEYRDYEAMIGAVKRKEIRVFVMDKPPALFFLFKYGLQDSFKYTDPVYMGQLHWAVPKGNKHMYAVVSGGFDKITQAEMNAVYRRWYGERPLRANFIRNALYGLAILSLLIIGMVVWNYSLSSRVRRHTEEMSSALAKLKAREDENESIIRAVPGSLFIIDNGIFTDSRTEEYLQRLPVSLDGIIGKTYGQILPQRLTDALEEAMNEASSTGEVQVREFFTELPRVEWYEAHIGTLRGPGSFLVVVRNITERKLAEQRIYELSIHDTLTGFYNRNYLEGLLERYKESCPLGTGIMVCDIDGLKLVNDTFGHLRGDDYIKAVSGIMSDIIGESAVIARFGGDEFIALFMDTRESILEGYKDAIEASIESSTVELGMPLSISVGYAVAKGEDQTVFDLYKTADDYMYSDKVFHMRSMKSRYVDLMSKMLEVRDFLTEGHGERLKDLAARLAATAGLSSTDIKDIKLLAQFHDIGKIGISDSILFKQASLTPEEMDMMKRHTEIGYRIAQASPELARISDYILKHHERYDGKGYPLGLSGADIPVHCRILSIIDAYDAMTNDRPYRSAMSESQAMKELEACSGSQFDPAFVDVFKAIVRNAAVV